MRTNSKGPADDRLDDRQFHPSRRATSRPAKSSKALRILSFRADAEEVTADVYTRIWRTAASYDARRGSVDAWLVSIARSRAIDRLRSRATRDRSEIALSVECSSSVNPESSAAASQTKSHLLQALHAIPFEQRRAIELAYFSGLTMTEIAEQLGRPIGSVKTRIRMGLMKLRRLLAAVA
jgi:RNA polymerase sigma-70 factor (ECF subfamily)